MHIHNELSTVPSHCIMHGLKSVLMCLGCVHIYNRRINNFVALIEEMFSTYIISSVNSYVYWSTDFSGFKTMNLKQSPNLIIGTNFVQHSAFTLDSVTGDLWVSTPDGDIIIYNATNRTMQLVVNATVLAARSGKNINNLGRAGYFCESIFSSHNPIFTTF